MTPKFLHIDEPLVPEETFPDYHPYAPSSYIPSKESLKFIAFIRACNVETNANAEIHYRLADKFFSDSKQVVVESFRGSAKSTVMLWFIIYAAVNGKVHGFGVVNFIAFVGDSAENGVKNFFRNIVSKIDKSKLLQSVIDIQRKTDAELELVNVDGHQLNVKGFGMRALSLDSKLYTEDGFTTIGECKVGDKIFGADGKLCTIMHKSEVFNKPMYELILKDGRMIKVSDDHLNSVIHKTNVHNKVKYVKRVMTTNELLDEKLQFTRLRKHKHRPDSNVHEDLFFIENTKALEYKTLDLPIDPYTLGCLLGDGAMNGKQTVRICGVLDDLKVLESNIPYSFGKWNLDKRTEEVYSVGINGLQGKVRELGVNVKGDIKSIPTMYLRGSIEQRLALLQGLMDTDGTVDKGGRTKFYSESNKLSTDIIDLVRSLGGKSHKRKQVNRNCYEVEIWLNMEMFKLPRKLVRQKYTKDTKVAIRSIRSISSEKSQCIAVDNKDHEFITDNYVITHNTNIRGVTYKGDRPDMVILDDVTTNDALTSEIIQTTINDNFYKAIVPALHPTKYRIYVIGTPISEKDLLHQLALNPTWLVHKFPICERFPCTKEEFVGNWTDRFPYEAVLEKYNMYKASGKLQDFYQEYMLEIVDLSTLVVDVDKDVKWFDTSIVLGSKSNYNFYITTDFAVSTKQSADYSTIGIWAINSAGDWMLVDGQCKRQAMSNNVDDLFNYAQKYSPMSVGIETSGQQGGFISWLETEMVRRNIYFTLATKIGTNTVGIRPTSDKLQRFVTGVSPRFKQGKIWLPKGDMPIRLKELVDELVSELRVLTLASGVKALKHDDALDLLNQLSEMDVYLPSGNSTNITFSEDEGIWLTDVVEESYTSSYDVI